MLRSLKNFLSNQLINDGSDSDGFKIMTCLRALKYYQSKMVFYVFKKDSLNPSYIAKIATNTYSATTLKSAFEMLQEFQNSPLFVDFAPTVPKPISNGEIHGFPVFVESFCLGRVFPQKKFNLTLKPSCCYDSAIRWIREFHQRTKRLVKGINVVKRLFLIPIEKTLTIFPEINDQIKPLQKICVSLTETSIPTVYTHGDFRAKNLLFGTGPEDIKVVDWEAHRRDYLPLFDLISLSVWFIYRKAKIPLFEGIKTCFFSNKKIKKVMEEYLSQMGIGENLKKILISSFLIERILHLHRERGKEGVKEHLFALRSWLKFIF